jgi:excisionase family DNA binding protein
MQSEAQDKLLLSPVEAARRLGIGRSKIYELAADGALPVVRIGKLIKFSPEGLRQWIEANQTTPRPASR